METLHVRLGEPIDDGNYPPRLVLADYYQGVATILRVNHDEEDVYTLLRQVTHIQRQNAKHRNT